MTHRANLIDEINPGLIARVPKETVTSYRLVPLSQKNGRLVVAVAEQPDMQTLNDLQFILNCVIEPIVFPAKEIERALLKHYKIGPENAANASGKYEAIDSGADGHETTPKSNDERSIINLMNEIFTQAIEQQVNDIHIEPHEHELRVRFRIDGALHLRRKINPSLKNSVISRVKVMADLDIAERRRPQDGRIRLSNGQKNIDIRVSTLPTDFGEKVVLRILDKEALELNIESLGLDAKELEFFKNALSSPHGIILVTGPTGSRKTTTLYSILNFLNNENVNILTIEDPIEYSLCGINQSHVRADIGFSFANALRTFLRQDPDIIMVGEIRDFETAEMAIRAALTGHLVLSTLHTNDAVSTITRLLDVGVEPFLVAACVRLVVAQRLVRKICPGCRKEVRISESALNQLEPSGRLLMKKLFIGSGCEKCFEIGYIGRTALFESTSIIFFFVSMESMMRMRACWSSSLRESSNRMRSASGLFCILISGTGSSSSLIK